MSDSNWDDLMVSHRITSHRMPEPQTPLAAVLACADARVSPSVAFHRPAGDLFEVRVAGNLPTEEAIASLDYAVSQADVTLVVVMGHTDCGAVGAARQNAVDPVLASVVLPIREAFQHEPGAKTDRISSLNVLHTIEQILVHPGYTGQGVRNNTVELRGVVHDLTTGELIPVASAGRGIDTQADY